MANLAAQIPIIGGLFDDSDQQALGELRKNQGIYQRIGLPQFQDYKPQDYQYIGDYTPTQAQATTISEDPMLRSAQQSALSKLAGLSNTGLSAMDEQGYQNARNVGNQVSRSGTDAAIANAQARHVGGSGMEMAMREMANQDGAGRAQSAAMGQAAQSAQQRALYNQAYLQGTSGLRSQDYQANAGNAGILNQFNAMNTQNQNQAQQYNLGNRQNISNQNVGQQNYAQQYNNQLKQQQYQDALSRASGMAGANNQMAQGYGAENAANTSARNSNTSMAASLYGAGAFGGAPAAAMNARSNYYNSRSDQYEE